MISVIVPVYNTSKYLKECLESLINQTYKELEIICVNDGSTDNSLEILEQFSAKDARIKIINQLNQGVSSARNNALKIASGEYIAFVDSDDWISLNYFESLLNAIERNNCDIACTTIIRKAPSYEKYRVQYTEEKIYTTLQEKFDISRIPICCYIWNKLYRSELVKNKFFKENAYYEDILWIPEVLKQASSIVTVTTSTYFYRVNSSSIVKKCQSEKKQNDLYFAKKLLLNFFDENKLQISDKNRRITKSLKYLCGNLILKEKEFNNELYYYLFGFIKLPQAIVTIYRELKILFNQIFSINKLDYHWLIYILGIQIRSRIKTEAPNLTVTQKGTTDTKRNVKIIASLTSFPERIPTVTETIKSLLLQTLKPDELVLWLAIEQFPNKENDLPKELLDLKNFGLSIEWCNDIRSYKKLIPCLKQYPNDIIITFDDDIYYENNVIEQLYNSYLLYPECIHTHRGSRISRHRNQLKLCNNARMYWAKYQDISFKNTVIGCGGVLYPPKSLYKDVCNEEIFKQLIPTQDDIWFWAMAVLNNTKIKMVHSKMQLFTIQEAQKYGLCRINAKNNKGLNGQDSVNRITSHYPEILEKIKP